MGFRYRKSINLDGGFRINLSKSGIGSSWGVKGYRVTKTAKGTTRTTASIPGTGISYVHETGKANNRSSQRNTNPGQQPVPDIDNNHYDTQNIVNSVATEMVSEGLEAMLASASRALKLKKTATVGFWITLIIGFANPVFLVLAAIFTAMFIYVKTKGMIDLDYREFTVNVPAVAKEWSSVITRGTVLKSTIDPPANTGCSILIFPLVDTCTDLKCQRRFGIRKNVSAF